MEDQAEIPSAPPQERALSYTHFFHHERSFPGETKIMKAYRWGDEATLVVDQRTTTDLATDLAASQARYEQALPQQEYFPNGLTRPQAVRVLTAQEVAFRFNGGRPDDHSLERNAALYAQSEEGAVSLGQFRGKGALSCAETAALAQQILSPQEKMTYISGAADLKNTGDFEAHSFNLIKTGDTKYSAAVLDLSNPIYSQEPNGTTQVKLYCAPITAEEFERLKKGEVLELNYGGEKRKCQFGPGPKGPKFIW